jgi:hypothetical protein
MGESGADFQCSLGCVRDFDRRGGKFRRTLYIVSCEMEKRSLSGLLAGVYIPGSSVFWKNTVDCVSVSLGVQVGCTDGHNRRNFHGDP